MGLSPTGTGALGARVDRAAAGADAARADVMTALALADLESDAPGRLALLSEDLAFAARVLRERVARAEGGWIQSILAGVGDIAVGALLTARLVGRSGPRGPRVVSSTMVVVEVGAALGFLGAGRRYGFRIDRQSDATLVVTEIDRLGVELSVGIGVDGGVSVGDDAISVDASASLSAALAGEAGESWLVESDDEAADVIAARITGNVPLVGGTVRDAGGFARRVVGAVPGDFTEDAIGKVLGTPLGWLRVRDQAEQVYTGVTYDPGDPVRTSETLEAGIAAEVSALGVLAAAVSGNERSTRTEHADGSTSTRVAYKASAEGKLLDMEGNVAAGVAVEVTVDPDANPSHLTAEWITQVGDRLVRNTMRFDMTSAAGAQQADLFLGDLGADPMALGAAAARVDLADRGVTWEETTWDTDIGNYGFDFSGALGGKLGVGLHVEVARAVATKQRRRYESR